MRLAAALSEDCVSRLIRAVQCVFDRKVRKITSSSRDVTGSGSSQPQEDWSTHKQGMIQLLMLILYYFWDIQRQIMVRRVFGRWDVTCIYQVRRYLCLPGERLQLPMFTRWDVTCVCQLRHYGYMCLPGETLCVFTGWDFIVTCIYQVRRYMYFPGETLRVFTGWDVIVTCIYQETLRLFARWDL